MRSIAQHHNKLPREITQFLSLEIFRSRLDISMISDLMLETDPLQIRQWSRWLHGFPYNWGDYASVKSCHVDSWYGYSGRNQQCIVNGFADYDCTMSTQQHIYQQPGWFLGIITAQIHLGLPCIQLFYSFVCFFWALLSYLTTRREAKSGNADSWEMHWHSCKYKPEDSTLHPHDVVCTEHQLFQKDLFWTAQAEWSRAQLRELKLCFLAEVCVKSQGFCAMVNVQ